MKSVLYSVLLASAVVLAVAADSTSFNGKWKVHNSISGNESDQECTFAAEGSVLTGSCSSNRGTVKISGKVDDKKITWMYRSEYDGQPLTVNYSGTLDEKNQIKGFVTVPEFSADGEFTAVQSK